MPGTPLARQSLVDELEERIWQDILAERYSPGALLPPERELSGAYGVTRATVKHALVRLEQKGLIETRHGVGSRVRDFVADGGAELLPLLAAGDETVLSDVFEARTLIGAVMAQLAAERRSDSDAALLEEQVAKVRHAESAEAAQAAELEVHRTLARATGSRVFAFMTNTLLDAYEQLRPRLATAFADPGHVADDLTPLAEAVRARDVAAAGTAATTYLEASAAAMRPLLTGGKRR